MNDKEEEKIYMLIMMKKVI